MKIAKRYAPELVVAKGKEPNPVLIDPYLDAAESKLVATDGRAMVVLPVETEKKERSRYLACSLLKAARQLGVEDVPAEIVDQEIVEFGVLWPTEQGRQFVPWQETVRAAPRSGDPGTHTISLNAKLLKALAEAMGTAGGVALTFLLEKPEAPIRVDPVLPDAEEFGLLMPLVSGEEDDVDPDQRCPVCKKLLAAGAACPEHGLPSKGDLDRMAARAARTMAEVREDIADEKRGRLEKQADEILKNAGAGELAKKELKGDAVAVKRKGGRR